MGISGAINLETLNPAVLLFATAALLAVLLVLFVVQTIRIGKMDKKLKTFMKGKDVSSLESEIVGLFKDNKHLTRNAMRTKRDIEDIRQQLLTHISKVGIIKYDAFQQMGGKLSFALCMLDAEDNGFILNTVQSSEGQYAYLKEIFSGQSTIELGREEKQALESALAADADEPEKPEKPAKRKGKEDR